MKKKQDVIIIGSGIGGLITGAELSNHGYRVTLFERLNQPGGYTNTFKRKEYTFESAIHYHIGFTVDNFLQGILDRIGLTGLEFKPLTYACDFYSISRGKILKNYLIHAGENQFIESLLCYFPDQREVILKAVGIIKDASADILRLVRLERDNPFMHLYDLFSAICMAAGKEGSVIQKIGFKAYRNIAYDIAKTSDDLFGFIENPDLRALFCHPAFFVGTPYHEISGLVIAIMAYIIMIHKPGFMVGGTQQLIDGCVDKIKASGGNVVYKAPVVKILTKNKMALGVRLEDGTEHLAKYVVCNSNGLDLYTKLLDQENLNPVIEHQVASYASSLSGFNLYLGLPVDLRDYGFQAEMSIFLSEKSRKMQPAKDCTLDIDNGFFISNFTLSDPQFSPPGKSSIVISSYARYEDWCDLPDKEYRIKKEATRDKLLENIKKITGLPLDKAEVCLAATPRTFKRYSGNVYGGILGNNLSVQNTITNRFDQKTPVKNLFHVGADTKPAASFSLALLSGYIASNKIRRGY